MTTPPAVPAEKDPIRRLIARWEDEIAKRDGDDGFRGWEREWFKDGVAQLRKILGERP